MNREERRRHNKTQRAGHQPPNEIPPHRLAAENQDFIAGTIFVAGAAGIRSDDVSGELPPLFVILLTEESMSPAPELKRLFALLEDEGTVSVNAQIRGTVQWGAMSATDGQVLAKLVLNLSSPVKTRPSFLLLADNYKEIWNIPSSGKYLLGLTTVDRYNTLGPDSSYADALEACVLLQAEPSKATQGIRDHYATVEELNQPMPPAVIVNAEMADEIKYSMALSTNFLGHADDAMVLIRPMGVTQIPMGENSIPTFISGTYAQRGLHLLEAGVKVRVAEGWSWTHTQREITIHDAENGVIASFTPNPFGIESQWLQHVLKTGQITVHIGDELLPDDGTPSNEQLNKARERGNVASGIITRSNSVPKQPSAEHSSPLESAPESVTPGAESTPTDTPARPWWKKLFKP